MLSASRCRRIIVKSTKDNIKWSLRSRLVKVARALTEAVTEHKQHVSEKLFTSKIISRPQLRAPKASSVVASWSLPHTAIMTFKHISHVLKNNKERKNGAKTQRGAGRAPMGSGGRDKPIYSIATSSTFWLLSSVLGVSFSPTVHTAVGEINSFAGGVEVGSISFYRATLVFGQKKYEKLKMERDVAVRNGQPCAVDDARHCETGVE
eukprot:6209318-Pleurochrysis_carterae.AAC.3